MIASSLYNVFFREWKLFSNFDGKTWISRWIYIQFITQWKKNEKKVERLRKDRETRREKFGWQKEETLIKKSQRKIEVRKESTEGKVGSRKVQKSESVGCKVPGLMLQSESSQETSSRLDVLWRNTVARIELEKPEERVDRLEVLKQNTSARMEAEKQRRTCRKTWRLDVLRRNTAERIESETPEERAERLQVIRQNVDEII